MFAMHTLSILFKIIWLFIAVFKIKKPSPYHRFKKMEFFINFAYNKISHTRYA